MARPTERLIFSTSIEPLVKVARGKVSDATRQKLEGLRISFEKKVDPAYPAEAWASAVQLIGAELFPGQPPDEQHRGVGKAVVAQFAETLIGRAIFATSRVIGPRRAMVRLSKNLRTGANFLETRFTEVDERHWELWMNDVSGVPGFYAGLLGAGADYVERWADRVDIKSRDGAACVFEMVRAR